HRGAAPGGRAGDGHDAPGRPAQGRAGHDLAGGTRPHRRLTPPVTNLPGTAGALTRRLQRCNDVIAMTYAAITEWFTAHLPKDLFTGPAEVSADGDEILVIGPMAAADKADAAAS